MRAWNLRVVLLAVLATAAAACGGRRPPVVTPPPQPPAPTLRVVNVTVFGRGGPVDGATVRLQGGTVDGDCVATTNSGGYTACVVVPSSLSASHLFVSANGYADVSQHVDLPPTHDVTIRLGDPEAGATQDIHLAALQPRGPPPSTVAGRLRAVDGRFVNDTGAFPWRGISEFDFVHLVRTGQEAELQRRLDRDVSIGARTVFRVFARAVNLFDLNANQPGYWEALDRTVAIVNGAGAYVELVLLPDAQLPKDHPLSTQERRDLVRQYGEYIRTRPGIIPQITNEPWNNGWSRATDPDLIDLGDLLASVLGHRDFSIGDPEDGDNTDASARTKDEAITLARHSNIIVIHSSRLGGAQPDHERYRRYIDHGESFYDVMSGVHQQNAAAACVSDEPMGFASQRWVPIPGRPPYEREFEPEATLADELTTQSIGCGHTAHYISQQDDARPEFWKVLGSIPIRIPPDSSWHYLNDSWQGSATHGFSGFGKCRTYTNGSEAYVTCNGTNKGNVTWSNGFVPNETVYDGDHLTVWHAQR